MTPILMNDFTARSPLAEAALRSAFERVLASGWYILGREVEEFERAWAIACEIKNCIGVANGLDAIEMVLRSLNIGVGDEVITTPMTAFATTLAVLRVGATPRFADIEPDTGLMSHASASALVTAKTKAIVPVHLYGHMKGTPAWQSLCRDAEVALIEDCAQAHLAEEDGTRAGGYGLAGAYSFYPTKNLGALGDAGAVVTNDDGLKIILNQMRNYGQSVRYHHPLMGQNSRLDELQAAFLTDKLTTLGADTARRQEIAGRYHDSIDNTFVKPLAKPVSSRSHVYHLFVVLSSARDALQAHLATYGIQTHIHYPVVGPDQEPLKNLSKDAIPHARRHAAECLSLPIHPTLSDEDIDRVITAVNGFVPS